MKATGPNQPRNVHVFGATSFLNDTASEMAYWILPAFVLSVGGGPATLGVIEGIAESVASFAKLLSGLYTDRIARRKPLVVSGYVVANAVKPLLASVTSAWQILGIRFADRLAKGVRGAPRDVLLAESVPPERVGAAFGLLQAMDSAGAIAGPLLALAIMGSVFGKTYGPRAVFIAAAIPGLLCVIVVAIGLREVPHTISATHKSIFANPKLLPPRFYFAMLAILLFSLANSSDMFLVLRAQELGVSARYAPLLGLVFNLTYTAGSWPAGVISDRLKASDSRFGRYAVVSFGLLLYAAVYWFFGSGMQRPLIFAAMAVYGVYNAFTQPVLKAVVADSVAREFRGGAFGIYYFVTSVAALVASFLTGALWKRFGAALPLHLSAALATIAAVLMIMTPVVFPKRS